MKKGAVFGLLAILVGFASHVSPVDVVWGNMLMWNNLMMMRKSPIIPGNFTYVADMFGQVRRVPLNSPEVTSFFSVEEDVFLELFTPTNPTNPDIFTMKNISMLINSNFDSKLPTRIFIHGWYSGRDLTQPFADSYLTMGNHKVNFIAVNWQKGSDIVNYVTVRGRVRPVAEHVAKFIDILAGQWIKLDDLIIVGHSLGAHISGIVGKKVTKGKVGKIVGLDPASPLFKFNDVNERLANTDAAYVEVIHTCAGTLGYAQPLGTASFYPNGGRTQPGCGWDMTGKCSHGRAWEFYLESLIDSQFYAFRSCDSLENLKKGNCSEIKQIVQMGGEPGNHKANGIFYLETNNKPVYGQGFRGVLQSFLSKKTLLQNGSNPWHNDHLDEYNELIKHKIELDEQMTAQEELRAQSLHGTGRYDRRQKTQSNWIKQERLVQTAKQINSMVFHSPLRNAILRSFYAATRENVTSSDGPNEEIQKSLSELPLEEQPLVELPLPEINMEESLNETVIQESNEIAKPSKFTKSIEALKYPFAQWANKIYESKDQATSEKTTKESIDMKEIGNESSEKLFEQNKTVNITTEEVATDAQAERNDDVPIENVNNEIPPAIPQDTPQSKLEGRFSIISSPIKGLASIIYRRKSQQTMPEISSILDESQIEAPIQGENIPQEENQLQEDGQLQQSQAEEGEKGESHPQPQSKGRLGRIGASMNHLANGIVDYKTAEVTSILSSYLPNRLWKIK